MIGGWGGIGYKRCFHQTIFTNSLEEKNLQNQELKDVELLQGKYPIWKREIVAIYWSNHLYSKDLEKKLSFSFNQVTQIEQLQAEIAV